MRKSLCLVLALVLLSGSLFALELSNSTFAGGVGLETINGGGKRYDTGEAFSSQVTGISLFGSYDVKVGKVWYTRVEFDKILFPLKFEYKGVSYLDSPRSLRSASKKRIGGYLRIELGKGNHLNIGGSITESDITVKTEDEKTEYTNVVMSVSPLIEWHWEFGKHFGVKVSANPDIAIFALDRRHFNGETGYAQTETRAEFKLRYYFGANVGLTFKF